MVTYKTKPYLSVEMSLHREKIFNNNLIIL